MSLHLPLLPERKVRVNSFVSSCTEILIAFLLVLAINSVTLLGRLGSAPQKRGTEEHPVVVLSLATHINMSNSQGSENIFVISSLKITIHFIQ